MSDTPTHRETLQDMVDVLRKEFTPTQLAALTAAIQAMDEQEPDRCVKCDQPILDSPTCADCVTEAESALASVKAKVPRIVAELRHCYAQMSQKALRDGLLSPQIAKLENLFSDVKLDPPSAPGTGQTT